MITSCRVQKTKHPVTYKKYWIFHFLQNDEKVDSGNEAGVTM